MPNYREVSRDLPKFVGILHFWILVTKILRHINIHLTAVYSSEILCDLWKRTNKKFWREKRNPTTPNHPNYPKPPEPTTPKLSQKKIQNLLRGSSFGGLVLCQAFKGVCILRGLGTQLCNGQVQHVKFGGFHALKSTRWWFQRCLILISICVGRWSNFWLAHIPSYFSNGLAGSTSNYLDVPGS